jgi:nitroreductase
VEAIHLAPSSYGTQPYVVHVITSEEVKAKLSPAAWGQAQITQASHLFIFCARTDVVARAKEYIAATHTAGTPLEGMIMGHAGGLEAAGKAAELDWTKRQTYIALGFALAAAAEHNISSCPMEGFNGAAFQEILSLPDNELPVVVLAVGRTHTDDAVALPYGPAFRFPVESLVKLA